MQDINTYSFQGKRAIVRVDFNVPLDDQLQVTDNTRIRAAIPTLKKVLEKGGSLILMSHLGRPKNAEARFSLRHILPAVEEQLGVPVLFAPDCMGEETAAMARSLKPGEVLLLENLRFYAEEEGKVRGLPEEASVEEKAEAKTALKKSQQRFTATLASYADCYINDAFGTAHRAHASTTLIAAHFPNDKMFGCLLNAEIRAMDKVLSAAVPPVTAILGGAKVSSKLAVLENLLDKVDNLIVCGGMNFTFIKARGGHIGQSLCEDNLIDTALDILKKAEEKNVRVYLPTDVVAADAFANDALTNVYPIDQIPDQWMGMDAGPQTLAAWEQVILRSKTLLWNGPAGVFEMPAFANGTRQLVTFVANATQNGAFSLIGGGDSVAAVNQMGYADKVSYVSTGGGAMLEYLEGKELPGIAAIRSNSPT
jgi:phosphoglycerate kinase